jgi:hypothetical protein
MRYLVLVAALSLVSCAHRFPPGPPPKAKVVDPATDAISVLKLTECGKVKAVFIVTADGQIHAADVEELSKDQLDGIDALAEALPEGNAGDIDLPCIPSQKT